MRNLMYQIAISLGLTLMMATLLVISPDKAQAKVKKQTGNSAKVKSQAKWVGVRNGNLFMPEIGDEVLVVNARLRRVGNANGVTSENTQLTRVKGKSNAQLKAGASEVLYETVKFADSAAGAKRRSGRNRNGGASFDIRKSKP